MCCCKWDKWQKWSFWARKKNSVRLRTNYLVKCRLCFLPCRKNVLRTYCVRRWCIKLIIISTMYKNKIRGNCSLSFFFFSPIYYFVSRKFRSCWINTDRIRGCVTELQSRYSLYIGDQPVWRTIGIITGVWYSASVNDYNAKTLGCKFHTSSRTRCLVSVRESCKFQIWNKLTGKSKKLNRGNFKSDSKYALRSNWRGWIFFFCY